MNRARMSSGFSPASNSTVPRFTVRSCIGRTPRLKLAVRRRPYPGAKLGRGKQMQYRRNKGNGTWLLKVSDGHGKPWTKAFAQADDFDESDGKTILTFFEAQDEAKRLMRGADGSADSAPITVDGALVAYRTDLISRSANPYNADWPRLHLTSALKSKPVALLGATELKQWRDGLFSKTLLRCLRAICVPEVFQTCEGRPMERYATLLGYRLHDQ